MSTIGKEIYDTSASFGKMMALISAVTTTIIGIILISIGIYLLSRKNIYTGKTKGTASNVNCNEDKFSQPPSILCIYTVTYKVNDKIYKKKVQTNHSVAEGEEITIEYDPSNPTNMHAFPSNTKLAGVLMISISTFIIGFSWLWFWITRKYKFAAATQGVSTGVGMLRGVL